MSGFGHWRDRLQLLQEAQPASIWILLRYPCRGENERALDWLEDNVDKVSVAFLAEVCNHKDLAEIQKHPRFQRVLHQLGISKEQLAAIPFDVPFDDQGRIVE